MMKLKHILYYYNILFLALLVVLGFTNGNFFVSPAFLFIILPLILYFGGYEYLSRGRVRSETGKYFWVIVVLLMVYDLMSTLFLLVANVLLARWWMDWLISLMYLSFPTYFLMTIYGWYAKTKTSMEEARKKRLAEIELKKKKEETEKNKAGSVATVDKKTVDVDRRKFLKLIGGAGIAMFVASLLNPKQAGAAFFGSVPGPGTVGIKDSAGNKIDPAEKSPTDGYKISQIDDAVYPHYYGCVNSAGSWYIMREDSSLAYRYAKGSTDFSTNWTNRASLAYDYFNITF